MSPIAFRGTLIVSLGATLYDLAALVWNRRSSIVICGKYAFADLLMGTTSRIGSAISGDYFCVRLKGSIYCTSGFDPLAAYSTVPWSIYLFFFILTRSSCSLFACFVLMCISAWNKLASVLRPIPTHDIAVIFNALPSATKNIPADCRTWNVYAKYTLVFNRQLRVFRMYSKS